MKNLILILALFAAPAIAYEAVPVPEPDQKDVLNEVDQTAMCSINNDLADAIEEKDAECVTQ